MNHTLVAQASVEIAADPATVWTVLTEPQHIRRYLFGTDTVTDWAVGSPIVFQGEFSGQVYRDKGVVRENLRNTRLSYAYCSAFSGLADAPENYALVTYVLERRDGGTRFTWEQRGFPDASRHAHAQDGLAAFLAQIKAIGEELAAIESLPSNPAG